jgi:hypothetical protein
MLPFFFLNITMVVAGSSSTGPDDGIITLDEFTLVGMRSWKPVIGREEYVCPEADDNINKRRNLMWVNRDYCCSAGFGRGCALKDACVAFREWGEQHD